MRPAHGTSNGSQVGGDHLSPAALRDDVTLDDVRRQARNRWEIAPITGGFRAIPRGSGGHTPIPRYGRTPAELAESIRMVEPRP